MNRSRLVGITLTSAFALTGGVGAALLLDNEGSARISHVTNVQHYIPQIGQDLPTSQSLSGEKLDLQRVSLRPRPRGSRGRGAHGMVGGSGWVTRCIKDPECKHLLDIGKTALAKARAEVLGAGGGV